MALSDTETLLALAEYENGLPQDVMSKADYYRLFSSDMFWRSI